MRFDLGEASGALGDLGTFVPIVVSLVAVCHLDVGAILLFAGLYNILTGVIFNQPIPVQPMKAIAAVAIAEALSPGAIAAAGIGAGVVVFALGATGLVEAIERRVPRSIVRGIQLGVGLKLLVKGVSMVQETPFFALDGWGAATIAAAFVLVSTRWKRFPSALVVFAMGLVVMAVGGWQTPDGASLGWGGLDLGLPTLLEWETGLVRGTVPQVPLTLLNSVIAVCALSADLYPNRGIGTKRMALSVGLMNIVGCWFGAMPMCHGAGGLAGQHRFGGRTGGSVVMLGAAKVLLAVGLGSAAALVLAAYPISILGVLLCFAGAELSLPARDCTSRNDFFLVVVTAGGTLGVNTAAGVVIGLVAAILLARRAKDRDNSQGGSPSGQ